MSKQKVMGRPKLPDDQRKQVFPLRFTAEQIATFEQAASKKRLPIREWITSTLTEAAAKIT